jgi:hypothetical protein
MDWTGQCTNTQNTIQYGQFIAQKEATAKNNGKNEKPPIPKYGGEIGTNIGE